MGKAIILSDQDFSQKNLGRVTFTITPEEKAAGIANAYCTEIGDTNLYDNIYAFALALVRANLWDKMKAVYPMYGDTIAKLCINLVSPGSNGLIVGGNATAGQDGKTIDFSRTIGSGDVGTPVEIQMQNEYSFFVGCKAEQGTGSNTWISYIDPVGLSSTSNIIALLLSINGIEGHFGRPASSYVLTNSTSQYYNNLVACTVNKQTGACKMAVNNNTPQSITVPSTSHLVNAKVNRIFGQNYVLAKDTVSGETITSNTGLADGKGFFYAIGDLTGNEAVQFFQIVTNSIIADKGITLGAALID